MKRVDSPAHFGALVKEVRRKHPALQSNCFFLPTEVEEMTRRQKLYAQEQESGLILFVEEDACSRLYYFLDKDASPVMPQRHKPVLLDYVFRGDEDAALAKAGSYKWQELGFSPYKRYRRMECTKESFLPPERYREKMEEFRIIELNPGDFCEVSKLWKSSLDVYSTFLPDESEYTQIGRAHV